LLFGGNGIDTLVGRNGNDALRGQAGIDWMYGGPGRDRLFGFEGNDRLFGGPGIDYLQGDAGRISGDGGGVGIEWLPTKQWNSTFANGVGEGTRDVNEFSEIISRGDSKSSPTKLILSNRRRCWTRAVRQNCSDQAKFSKSLTVNSVAMSKDCGDRCFFETNRRQSTSQKPSELPVRPEQTDGRTRVAPKPSG